MRDPPRARDTSITDRAFLGRVLLTGMLTASVGTAVYVYGLGAWGESVARGHVFSMLVFSELLRSFSWRSDRTPLWRMDMLANGRLAAVVAGSLALQVAIHQWEPLRALFHTTPLAWSDAAVLVGAALVPVGVLELIKLARALPLWRRESRPCPS